jgi:hypothetical protein
LSHAALSSALVGVGAGVLSYLGGNNLPDALMTGGGATGATLTIAVAVLTYLGPPPDATDSTGDRRTTTSRLTR